MVKTMQEKIVCTCSAHVSWLVYLIHDCGCCKQVLNKKIKKDLVMCPNYQPI